MSHEVETMMFVGQLPWHRLGTKLDNPPTTQEALIQAGLDWEVGLKDLVTVDGESVSHKAAYRMSDGQILGVVGPGSHPYQNRNAFAWFDPFVEGGQATLETAGSLRGGRRVWILAKLKRDASAIVAGDDVNKYILLAHAHDGSLSIRVGFTPVRVVCANTLAMAQDCDASKLLRIRHTKHADKVMEEVRDIMNLADASFEATAEQYRSLARKQVHAGDLDKYVKLVLKRPATAREAAAEAQIAAQKAATVDVAPESNPEIGGEDLFRTLLERPVTPRNDDDSFTKQERASRGFDLVKELFENGRGNEQPNVRGTWWAAYNAVTEFVTHHRGRTDEARLQATFSDGSEINRRALTTALQMAN